MSETPAAKTELPPPAIGELFELSMTALVNAPGVFFRLAERPAPRPGASFLVALAWGAAFFALNLVHVALSHPGALSAFAPWKIGAVAAGALGLWAALYLLASSLVYGLGRVLGSAGDFDRALLVATITLAAAPVQALCSWFPVAWVVPTLLAAWIAACGLNALFKTDPWAARGVFAVLAAGILALQYGAGLAVEKYSAAAQLAVVAAQAAPMANQLAELQTQMQQVQAIADDTRAAAQNAQTDAGDSPQANRSGLDLLRGPAAEEPRPLAPAQQQQLAQMSAAGDAMNKSVLTMLDSISPMLNNPMITQNMNPRQKSDFAELQKMILELKTGMAANSITSPQEQQAKMMKIQQLVMRMMSAGITLPDAPPGKRAPKGTKP